MKNQEQKAFQKDLIISLVLHLIFIGVFMSSKDINTFNNVYMIIKKFHKTRFNYKLFKIVNINST